MPLRIVSDLFLLVGKPNEKNTFTAWPDGSIDGGDLYR
jgi:hypothetical protein